MSKEGIRILTQYFYPDVASTGQLLGELAFGLADKGLEVSALTALPSYSYKIEAKKKEKFHNVNISRLWTTKLNKNTKIGQLLNSISFFTNIFFHLLFSSSKTPLLIVSNPPFLPIVGYFIKKLKKINYIYLIHDVFPEKAYKLNYVSEKSIFIKIWSAFDKKVLSNASEIIVLSEAMKKVVETKMKNYELSHDNKIFVIHNWADGNFIKPVEKLQNSFLINNNLSGKFVVMYSGNIGASYDLEALIETARLTKENEFAFLFIGDGVKKKKLQDLASSYNLTNIAYLPYQLKKDLPFSLTAPSVSVVTYESYLEGLLMPSKLYTTLAAGVPVIALCSKDSEVAKIIEEAKCGFIVEKNDAQQFYNYILKIKNDPALEKELGMNARKYFEENFALNVAVDKYYNVIKKLS
ncbi:MAG: glycosyltransferase family 4 protein [Bacteroidetes bacterium]|nr:glycosyltransferase family 4 protein [Bacteroidota bacterium]